MKYLSYMILLVGVLLTHQTIGQTGEERMPLNGLWQFNTLIGEGSNSLDIQPGENDILIDNAQKAYVETSGKWLHPLAAT